MTKDQGDQVAMASPRPEPGALLWMPSEETRTRSNIGGYVRWLRDHEGREFTGYGDLWTWSVTDLEGFWSSLWRFFSVRAHRPPTQALSQRGMPGTRWFPGAELNYAEHALARRDAHPAVIAGSETRPLIAITHAELYEQVAAVAAALARLGVRKGDRVVAYLPNIPETLVAFLATASLGAIWASCPPEFGARSVVDRFRQIEPRVLFVTDGYRFKGRAFNRIDAAHEVRSGLPSVEHMIVVPYLNSMPPGKALGMHTWAELFTETPPIAFAPVPFDHPLWVLYSSGTTGLPKAIVQGHGGILLEHLKTLALHLDLTEEDRFFWQTTTGWMMWNFLIGGLLLGSTVVLYDGHPAHPDPGCLWRFAEEAGVTYFGTSAPHLHACMKAGVDPSREADLRRLKGLGSTAAPLAAKAFHWVYRKVNARLLLNPFSGGTDLCTGIVGACPLVPVRAGEIPCRLLGASVEAYDEDGRPVLDRVGELVLTQPMPSMPVRFWNDPDDRRYRESYFARYPGVWRHGDWITVTREGGCVIHGRSDSTLNRSGVRMGTSEFYRAIEDLPEIVDSLVIDTGGLEREGELLMFVVLAAGCRLSDTLEGRIRETLRTALSPRHVPDEIHVVDAIPYTLNGKKVEVPVKRILLGTPVEEAVSRAAVANPASLDYFAELAGGRKRGRPSSGLISAA